MQPIAKPLFIERVTENVFDGRLPPNAAAGLSVLLDEIAANWPLMRAGGAAFACALMHYETTRRFVPLEDRDRGAGKMYGHRLKKSAQPYVDTENLFYGRGIVPLVWYENYQTIGAALGLDLIQHPELMLEIDVAVKAMLYGISNGIFTGKRIDDFITDEANNFDAARDVIMIGDRQSFFTKLCGLYLDALDVAAV